VFEFLIATASTATSLGGPADIWAAIVKDFSNITEPAAFAAFVQVLLIDLVLAGDNAIVVGALAAGLPPEQRKKVILIGLMVTWLLGIVGLVLAGGLLLLWVAWRMYRDIKGHAGESTGSPEIAGDEHSGIRSTKTFAGAAWGVAVADVSMSLDNVLAVAGAAREHPGILIVGLIFAVALMGIAANIIAQYIERYRWIAWVGLAVIIYVAIKMIYEGWSEVQPHMMAFAGM
jgi:YjbE family integral membrane protein